MLVADVTTGHPVLLETLRRVPDTSVEWEMTYTHEKTEMLFWITSDDFEAVEVAMSADDSVADPTVLATVGDRRLYRVEFTAGDEIDLMSELMDVGGLPTEVVGTPDGWECRIQFPDREAVSAIRQYCHDHDIPFRLHRLFEETDPDGNDTYSLTPSQRETLIAAVESGYLEVPRQCNLSELSERFDVSDTAISNRFRRGVATLVRNTIYPSSREADDAD